MLLCVQNLFSAEQKGTISTLEAVDGLLLACMAQKVKGGYISRFV